jgi:hypothetical protein
VYRAPGQPVNGVYTGTLIGSVRASTRSFHAQGLQPNTSYAFWVEATDTGGFTSTDGPLRVTTTAVDFGDTNGHVFEQDVAWLSSAGVTKGCNPPSNGLFCPDNSVTRGEMATFLVRALGLTGGEGSNFFWDDNDSVHQTNIDRLAYWEITTGCNPPADDRFCPDDPVTRAQMASFLARALLLSDGWDIDYFDDDDSSVHVFNINRLAHSGITKGCDDNSYCPEGLVTRGQMAAFLKRGQVYIDTVRGAFALQPLDAVGPTASRRVVDPPS